MISRDKLEPTRREEIRSLLEQKQIGIYIFALLIAIGFRLLMPDFTELLNRTISLVIAILMYSMFSQIPFTSLAKPFEHKRFIGALLAINFIVVPIVVWLLTMLLPDYPPLLLGVYLVLLTPCIDYVIVFTSLGRGNEKQLLLATPILFIAQIILLPLYLWLFMGKEAAGIMEISPFLEAFFILIILPLGLAIATQIYEKKSTFGTKIIGFSAWLPVPFMALTLFVVVSSQIGKLSAYTDLLIKVVPIYIGFMIIMPILSKGIAKAFKLDIKSGRAVLFSGSTRNSLVVLPLALALPSEISAFVAAIIVTQTIVELIGELIYIRIIPNFLLRDE